METLSSKGEGPLAPLDSIEPIRNGNDHVIGPPIPHVPDSIEPIRNGNWGCSVLSIQLGTIQSNRYGMETDIGDIVRSHVSIQSNRYGMETVTNLAILTPPK